MGLFYAVGGVDVELSVEEIRAGLYGALEQLGARQRVWRCRLISRGCIRNPGF